MSETWDAVEQGISAYPSPLNYARAAVANQVIIPGPIRVEGFTAASTNSGSQYVLAFDAMELPAEGAVPLFFLPVTANAVAAAYWGARGRIFLRGLVLCTSSTNATKTINATADTFLDVQYTPLGES